MRIEIHETVSQRPRGDRDTQRHPSSAFDVILFNGDEQSTLFSNDQFNAYHSSISGSRIEYLKEAKEKAIEFSHTIGCKVILEPNLIFPKIKELRDRIAKDTEELRKLERQYDQQA